MGRRVEMVSLEEYMAFYEEASSSSSPDDDDGGDEDYGRFTLPKLHQIIHMHGFCKLHSRPKRELLDALESVDLMSPARSTLLRRGVSPGRVPRAKEVVSDLAALGWEECPVRVVHALAPVNNAAERCGGKSPVLSQPSTPSSSSSPAPRRGRKRRRRSCPAAFVVAGRRPRTKRKSASINALVAAAGCLPGQTPSPDPPPLPASPPPPTPSPPSSPPAAPLPFPSPPFSPNPPPPPTVPPPSPPPPPPSPPPHPPPGFPFPLHCASPPLLLRPLGHFPIPPRAFPLPPPLCFSPPHQWPFPYEEGKNSYSALP